MSGGVGLRVEGRFVLNVKEEVWVVFYMFGSSSGCF